MKNYTAPDLLPMAIDIIGYKNFYQTVVGNVCINFPIGTIKMIDLGVRYGCSSRMLMEAVPRNKDYSLVLVDPVDNNYIQEIVGDNVVFHQAFAEDIAKDTPDNEYHVIHVDVDPHGYEQTKNLLNLYKSKVKIGGAIICHDCTPATGVLQAVTEFGRAFGRDWNIIYCKPDVSCPQSSPCVLWRIN